MSKTTDSLTGISGLGFQPSPHLCGSKAGLAQQLSEAFHLGGCVGGRPDRGCRVRRNNGSSSGGSYGAREREAAGTMRWGDDPLREARGRIRARCTTIRQFLCCLRRFVGRTPWSAADAHVGPALVAAMLLGGADPLLCAGPSGPALLW
jgi:hypothetical protein